ncbi:hypothetical protein SAMN05216431_103168 [Ligilactobacillus sp. WC1T17]|uniref:DUF202 domain-containing protein n=1 Tax=Ligilactobacillus ruminis TaxID=1623 RepID=A0ABY1AAG2_9LACO|nr:hypothetical protein SAMN05216431_103168 [Ligilactobacillus ruminis]
MTKEEMVAGYQHEVEYQKHMLANLKHWYNLFMILTGIGIVLIYFFHRSNTIIFGLGIFLTMLGFLGVLLFSYGIYRGRINVQRVIDDLDSKLKALQK